MWADGAGGFAPCGAGDSVLMANAKMAVFFEEWINAFDPATN